MILANVREVKSLTLDEPFAIKQTDQIVGMAVHLIEVHWAVSYLCFVFRGYEKTLRPVGCAAERVKT